MDATAADDQLAADKITLANYLRNVIGLANTGDAAEAEAQFQVLMNVLGKAQYQALRSVLGFREGADAEYQRTHDFTLKLAATHIMLGNFLAGELGEFDETGAEA